MQTRKQGSTAYPILLFLADSLDGKTGKTGLTPAVQLSKNAGAFAAAAGAVSEIGSGWYALTGDADDRDTLGELAVRATAAGADPFNAKYLIVPFDPFDAASLGLSNLDAPVSTVTLESGGEEAILYTYTLYEANGVTPVPGASVWVTENEDGTGARSRTYVTDALGRVRINLLPGPAHFQRYKAGYNVTNPDTETVS